MCAVRLASDLQYNQCYPNYSRYLRFVSPEHVHTAFTLVDNVHFVQEIVPDLGVADLQGLYDLSDARHGGFDARLEQSRVRASVENVGVLPQWL